MPEFTVTIHAIVKNEDQFIYFSLKSVLPFVAKALIIDTGSTDRTWEIIEKLKNEFPDKIEAKQIKINSPQEISNLRENLIKLTKTQFFMLLDGDEIWPQDEILELINLSKTLPQSKIAVVNKTRNCVGDIYHYLPESFGHYKFLDKIGHYNIRLMRTLDYKVKGIYPEEGYVYNNKLINNLDDKLEFSSSWYLHTTHLNRSTNSIKIFGRRKQTYSLGIKMTKTELPQALLQNPKSQILKKRSIFFLIKALIYDLIRFIS